MLHATHTQPMTRHPYGSNQVFNQKLTQQFSLRYKHEKEKNKLQSAN